MDERLRAHLRQQAARVRTETLEIHGVCPETRIASSLSAVELFVALYYGPVLRFDAAQPAWPGRDRVIVSKGHGAVSLYPVLADLGFFGREELARVGQPGSFLGSIPDPRVPGFESINGSLGHGAGVACGVALALRRKRLDPRVFVVVGDGELYEGALWEAVMFASHHRLGNLILIVDRNGVCMLDSCRNVIDLDPLDEKFRAFGWASQVIDGHDVEALYSSLLSMKTDGSDRPKALIANTVKGKGVEELEGQPLCHVRSLSTGEIEKAIKAVSGERPSTGSG